jgi:hypothetical protein
MPRHFLIVLSAAVLAACGSAVQTVAPKDIRPAPLGPLSGPFVQAGMELQATLDQPLSTQTSRPGEIFTARVEEPLISPDGEVIVPRGAMIIGHVVKVQSGPARLVVAMDRIQTNQGPAPLQARIKHADKQSYLAGARPSGMLGDFGYPGMSTLTPSASIVPFGPNAYGYTSPTVVGELRLRRGAPLRMVLTRPIVPPGTRLHPSR